MKNTTLDNREPLLKINNLKVYFDTDDSLIKAVDGVDLKIMRGTTLGLVGESGCGKSVTCLSIARLIPCPPGRIAGGEIIFKEKNLLDLAESVGGPDELTEAEDDGERARGPGGGPEAGGHRLRASLSLLERALGSLCSSLDAGGVQDDADDAVGHELPPSRFRVLSVSWRRFSASSRPFQYSRSVLSTSQTIRLSWSGSRPTRSA